MRKPRIGITPLWDEEKKSIWLLPGYMDSIREAGGIPLILPLHMTEEEFVEVRDDFDGFLFTGGQDIWGEEEGLLRSGVRSEGYAGDHDFQLLLEPRCTGPGNLPGVGTDECPPGRNPVPGYR